jgi:peptidoglycan L-alanyl-D-glutamate endopeptidase CwlK
MRNFSKRSLKNLDVHPDLKKVAHRALELLNNTDYDFIVTDGGRTVAEQKEFVRRGASKTMNSRHLGGFALDYVAIVYDGSKRRVTYDAGPMKAIAARFKQAGKELGIPVEWGGDWKSFVDQPHIQLRKKEYPG